MAAEVSFDHFRRIGLPLFCFWSKSCICHGKTSTKNQRENGTTFQISLWNSWSYTDDGI
jgi:hypothetical protein